MSFVLNVPASGLGLGLGLSVIVRNHLGEVIVATLLNCRRQIKACLDGLNLAREAGLRGVVLECLDAASVVNIRLLE
ncbi:hypothetical protein Q3G72_009897 [Acer saccharum]|nr:hypothetical protein Q3G72_009897 [Acer saccharum]